MILLDFFRRTRTRTVCEAPRIEIEIGSVVASRGCLWVVVDRQQGILTLVNEEGKCSFVSTEVEFVAAPHPAQAAIAQKLDGSSDVFLAAARGASKNRVILFFEDRFGFFFREAFAFRENGAWTLVFPDRVL